jgi:hypothetical protein
MPSSWLQVLRSRFTSNKRGWLLAVAVFLFAAVVVRWGVYAYHERSRTLDQQIELKQLQYDKYSRILRNGKEYVSMTADLEKFQQDLVKTRFVWDETPSLSEARFQNIVKKLASANHVDVRMTKVLPRKTLEQKTFLQLRINCRAEIGAIRDFFIGVQNDPHYLFFHKVEIKIISRREKRYYYLNAELMALTTLQGT